MDVAVGKLIFCFMYVEIYLSPDFYPLCFPLKEMGIIKPVCQEDQYRNLYMADNLTDEYAILPI